jgi:hypothetical protein
VSSLLVYTFITSDVPLADIVIPSFLFSVAPGYTGISMNLFCVPPEVASGAVVAVVVVVVVVVVVDDVSAAAVASATGAPVASAAAGVAAVDVVASVDVVELVDVPFLAHPVNSSAAQRTTAPVQRSKLFIEYLMGG